MAEKLKYHAFKRNTLLEELQTILHEYPDNEQIIKELLQNAEDAGARVVKMGFCPSSRSQNLPDPYKKYLSGPAFCFYNDSVFEEKDWEGITMVRKSNKHDDPLKVGKFGIGFKSVFHITDTVVVISGTSILFIDPLYEEIDPRKVCCQVSISDFVQQDVCGPQALESLYRLFGINEDTIRGGTFAGTVFWFPLRNSPSNLSENVYTPKKVSDLLASFKKEIGTEMLFLTSIEEIGLFNMVNCCWETDTVVSLDNNCAKGIRKERERYKTEIKAIEDHMESDERWITSNFCNPVWMKCSVTYNVETDGETSRQEWLVINYFHAGTMSAEISNLIRNRRSKYRPYIGIAARLDQPIACGQLFCFLPLPFEDESSTGLPVHVNGFFSLDSNRQHIKWPSYDQTSSKSHLENDMLWNVCMVQEILPIVYKELFEFWRNNPKLGQMDLRIFYHCIPRKKDIKHHWDCVEKEINEYMLVSRVPCIEKRAWVNMKDAYFAIFEEDIKQDVRDSVIDVFSKCGKKVVILGEHEDLFKQWNSLANLSCTSPMETRNLLKIRNEYKGLQRSCKEHLLLYCCSDDKLSQLGGIELLPLQNKKYHTFQEKQKGKQDNIYLCEKEELEILIGKEGSLVLKDSTELGHLLQKLATSGYYAFQKLYPSTWIKFLCEISKKTEMKTEKPKLLRQSSAIYGDNWLAKVWRYLANLHQLSLDPVQELFLIKTKESDELKKVSDVFFCETDIDDCYLKTLAYFKIWVVDTTFHDNYLLKPGRGIVQEFTNEGKRKVLERCITNGLLLFNNQSTDTEKEWFKTFLPDTTPKSLISSIQKLNIFKCFSSVHPVCSGYTSLDQCDKVYIGNRDFPIQFPTKMIMSTNRLEERLLLELNASIVDLTECVQNLLKENGKQLLKATDEVKRRFCFYVLGKKLELRNWEKIQTHLNEVKFIKNGTEQLYSAKDLYDPNDCVLKELFLGESKFPEERTEEMALLCNVAFQNCQSSEFMLDIVRTCQKFDKISSVLKERKSDALLQILRQNPKIVESLCKQIDRFKVVPFKEERNSNYPKSMNWYAQPEKFVSLEMMYSSQYIFIIGSVLPTPKKEWEEFIDRSKQPALSDVIGHFHKVVMCYTEEEHTGYRFMMKKVYQYLEGKIQSIVVKLPTNCVLTDNGFLPASKIYIETKTSDVDLKPYFIPLPREYVASETLRTLFEKFGGKKHQSSDLLVQCLTEIEKSHQEKNTESDSIEDIIKIEQILKTLSELTKEELAGIQNRIKVPIQTMDSDKLEFRFAQECAYSDSDWFSKTFTEEDDVCLIHSKIDKGIAEKIGVKSLKKFTISDAEEICSEFGQSEPLTQRLNRLLEEGYTDGLSVPKELIQNADDAGATEVYFLYDERENEDAKCCLLDAKMEECQGPALWAFNNAVFTSRDFENIQKLSGATKKQDTTKIGKFGLGFNAVYNITDVPSFVSGTHLVYLDPHGKYLGDAIVNKRSPGIKLNLKNGVMLRKLVNQFEPYQNVFGFRSSVFSENEMYKGTLFRFPLRTKSQSMTSEISSKEYSPKEMEKLMKQFCKTSGNMILFTQNVKQIKIFHVDRGCVNPDREMKLVLTIKKEENCGQTSKKWEHNILRAASNHCSSGMHAPKFLETFNTKIILSSEGHSWIDHASPFREETNWVVTWALGQNKSLRLFEERESDGALPLSSVGIPVDIDNGNISPVFLGTRKPVLKKFGFYDIGHLFCFLPLPIKSPLAFHVNGTFAVSSDRQRLLTRTEDDKDNTKQSVWNDSLLSDATLEAILELLFVINNSAAGSYLGYELWPTMGEDVLWKTLQDEFFKAVVERCLPVFKTHQGYKTFKQCLFLHIDINSDEYLRKIAFDILRENPLDRKTITEIPDDIYKKLEACHGKYFLTNVVSYEKFITKSFLPNIVKFSGDDYDKIVLGALRSKNENILRVMKDCNCITTCQEGRRKCPKDLVHPRSLVSGIFLTEDKRFPSDLFCSEKDLNVLVSLGMMKDEIQLDLLKIQTSNVRNLSRRCTECAFLRSKNIVHYVAQKDPKKFIEISDIPFLPVKEKPDNWPVSWAVDASAQMSKKCSNHKKIKSSIQHFERPCNLYYPSSINLVGCSKPLLGRYEDFSFNREELQLLGLKKEKDIDVKTLYYQVTELTKTPENAQNKVIEDMCRELYRTLSERLTEPDIENFVCNQLSKMPCVITEKAFVYPKHVIFSLMHDCSPYLYGLRPWCVRRFTQLMEKCGVRNFFESDDIINALLRIKNENDGKKLSKDSLGLVSRIANLFEDCHFIPVENLFLPDTNEFFCHVNDLCIDDVDWISTTESMKFLNTTISLRVAKMVGIKSKRDQSILIESEDIGDDFGQHEELTNRIKRILDGYPEASILKELLQNADDAGATELHFIKDFRYHGTEHIFSDNWKELQGPALCVYNDSVFTEKDLIGIQNLGIGSKGEDPTSTGQYGVGFNVVYHLTDAPSFLTRDIKNNMDTLCVLDPHRKYISSELSKKPGRKFLNASEVVGKRYTDIMPCFLEQSDIWNSSRGTLFRFPLRCNAHSLLSHRTTSCDELTDLLNVLKKEIAECLLFLHNVRKVSISTVNEDGSLRREFVVKADISNKSDEENLHTFICNVRENMKKDGSYPCNVARKEIKYILNLHINNEYAQEWLVVMGFGFMDKRLISPMILKAYSAKQLALLPTSGVAFNLKNKRFILHRDGRRNVNERLVNFRPYCFLPLPVHTGLPVHVNGHFALDHEARRNIWWPDEEGQDLKVCWNRCLIENVIVPTYITVLEYLKTTLLPNSMSKKPLKQMDKFHTAFPCMKSIKDKIWQHTVKTLYIQIAETKRCVFPIVRREYEKLEMGSEDVQETEKRTQQFGTKNPILKEDTLEIKWVSLLSGGFPSYFDEIRYQLRDDLRQQTYYGTYGQSFLEIMKWSSMHSEFLSGVLKDLGMKIIESPMWIFNSMKDAGINVQTVSPKEVLRFLKLYSSIEAEKCNIEKVPIHVSKTRFQRINGVYYILEYCLKDKSLTAADFQNVPLLLSEAEIVHEFEHRNQIFLTSVRHLLPFSADSILHFSQYHIFQTFSILQEFVKNLQIEDFSTLIVDNVPKRFRRGKVETWDMNSSDLPNGKWIKRFWLFLAENVAWLEQELKNKIVNKKENKQKNYEHLIKQLCCSVVTNIGDCSFLPVSNKGTCSLFPLKEGKHVLKLLPKQDCSEQLALKQLNVPLLYEEAIFSTAEGQSTISMYHCSEVLRNLVATVESVLDTLDCVYFNRKHLNCEKNACLQMLEFFVRHMDTLKKYNDCKIKLRCLPFYCGLVDSFMTLSEKKDIIVLPDKMPADGLYEFGLQKRIQFVNQTSVPLQFFEYLGCISRTATELYIHYILPHFGHLPVPSVQYHIKFIKDIIVPQLNYSLSKDDIHNLDLLRKLLRKIPFIPVGPERQACASEFFNPHKEMFQIENQLCSPEELPPPPYDGKEWEEFLVHCGMKSDMTSDIFADFANRLETLAKRQGINATVKTNSKRMVSILFSDPELTENYSLQDARFLTPHDIHHVLLTVAPEFERKDQLLCFRDATLPSNDNLVWTVMGIVSESITNIMCKADIYVAVKNFRFMEVPPLRTVLNHTTTVCHALTKNMKKLCTENADVEKVVTTAMTQIYNFLQKNQNHESVNSLKAVPFVFIKERTIFVTAGHVVLDINTHEEIPPYLCKASLYFGQFYSLFESHGAAKCLSCSHLANVLFEIWTKSKGTVLEPNEILSTKKAVQILFSKLRTENNVDLNVSVLYLPSKKNTLIQSNNLVFIDDILLEKRIGNNMPEMDYFVGFRELCMEYYEPVSEINRLPEKYRPRLLSKVVVEQLDSECKKCIIPSTYAKKLQSFLHCLEFLAGVCRLVRDEQYKNDSVCGEEVEIEIQKKLQSVEVRCVEHLTTVMTHKSKILPNTCKQKSIFSAIETDDVEVPKLCIYFAETDNPDDPSWIKKFTKQVSISLNVYLGKPLKENHIHLPDILKCINDPGAIEIELDNLDICRIETKNLSKLLPFMPELGSEIPIVLHHLLDNSCTYIDPGEYVAYELFDPIIDEDDACETEPVYILAKVLETNASKNENPNADEWTISYLLDIGSDQPIEVVASKVYKFIRSNADDTDMDVVDCAVVFSWNFDRVKCYIRDVLKNAFARGDQEFRRTLKRLLLQYHPDKHLDNKDYFNELTLFIYFVKKRLENGESVDDAAIFNFNKKEEYPRSHFTENVFQRGTRQGRNQRSYTQSDDYFSQFFSRGSQPGQARRWYRQAEFDFQASTSDKHQPGAYNWACYKSHQSAEKALKALQYQLDADHVIQTHRLPALTSCLNDSELSGLALRLEGVTGNYFQMRYPDAVPSGDGMRIPSDLYNAAKAQEAIELAAEILHRVRSKIPNL